MRESPIKRWLSFLLSDFISQWKNLHQQYLPSITVYNLNETKNQIAIWIDSDPRSVPLISTPYSRTTPSYRPVLISLRLIQVVILLLGIQDLLFRILMVVLILNLMSMRLSLPKYENWFHTLTYQTRLFSH